MLIGKGNYFGEIDLIFFQNRKFSATAQTDVELLVLSSEDYKAIIIKQYSMLAGHLRKMAMARRIK